MRENYRDQRTRRNVLGAIEYLFKYLEQKIKVEIWITHCPHLKFQGIIRGFDEWMNLVMEQTVEIDTKKNTQKKLGRMLLKGDTICLVRIVDPHSLK
jgi:small nuclear ribonucleoprotein E